MFHLGGGFFRGLTVQSKLGKVISLPSLYYVIFCNHFCFILFLIFPSLYSVRCPNNNSSAGDLHGGWGLSSWNVRLHHHGQKPGKIIHLSPLLSLSFFIFFLIIYKLFKIESRSSSPSSHPFFDGCDMFLAGPPLVKMATGEEIDDETLGGATMHSTISNFLFLFYFILFYHIISYHIISYHIISYHIISYHIISYHIISYNII